MRATVMLAAAAVGLALTGCQADPQEQSAAADDKPPTTHAAPAITDACTLLPKDAVRTALGAAEATTSSSQQGSFLSCQYALRTNVGEGTLLLDVSASRGGDVYQSAADAAGFEPVDEVGDEAAYSPEQARLVVTSNDVFVQLSMPPYLQGSTILTPAKSQAAAIALAERIYQSLS